MKGGWWKIGAVLLLLYVVIVGLRTPLAPALVHASVDRIAPGPVSFDIKGYNTHFTEGSVTAWLENDGQQVCSAPVEVLADDRARVTVTVPQGFRKPLTSVWVFTAKDGPIALHDAFFTEGLGDGITGTPCRPGGKYLRSGLAFPDRAILNETIRNLFFHVPMWFAMMALMTIAVWQSVRVLRSGSLEADRSALSAVHTSLLFAALGLTTGSLWARVTWGGWWTSDPKLNGSAVTVLIYAAYLVLRGSVPDAHKRARLAAVYNVFAYALMLVFLMVLPRLTDSLHPGNGGNPAFSTYDLDSSLRAVFYPAVLGWIGLACWAYTLTDRTARLNALAHEAHDR